LGFGIGDFGSLKIGAKKIWHKVEGGMYKAKKKRTEF
jgi:hypothetical protein